MKIGVPGSYQRNFKGVSEVSTELPKLPRTGYVNYIGAKFLESTPSFLGVAPKPEVVAQIAFDGKTERPAGQFQTRHRTFVEIRDARSTMHGQKRPPLALRKGHELPGGQRHAIDLLKRFAKQRDARNRSHKLPS